jgi:hypothetical protein
MGLPGRAGLAALDSGYAVIAGDRIRLLPSGRPGTRVTVRLPVRHR